MNKKVLITKVINQGLLYMFAFMLVFVITKSFIQNASISDWIIAIVVMACGIIQEIKKWKRANEAKQIIEKWLDKHMD